MKGHPKKRISSEVYDALFYDKRVQGKGWSWIKPQMPILKRYAQKCESVTEFGVSDWNSTWAFVDAGIKRLRSYDKDNSTNNDRAIGGYSHVKRACKENGIDFQFFHRDTRDVTIEETDLLFVDTMHTYEQVKAELKNADKVKKYILFHDTILYGKVGGPDDRYLPEDGKYEGILKAIEEFLNNNKQAWRIAEVDEVGNGLMAIERINPD